MNELNRCLKMWLLRCWNRRVELVTLNRRIKHFELVYKKPFEGHQLIRWQDQWFEEQGIMYGFLTPGNLIRFLFMHDCLFRNNLGSIYCNPIYKLFCDCCFLYISYLGYEFVHWSMLMNRQISLTTFYGYDIYYYFS